MAKIVINDTREIELLDAIKNPDALNFKFGDKYAELTTDLGKTNGSPQLKFSKDGNEYYIREKFMISGSFSASNVGAQSKTEITHFFPGFNINTRIKEIKVGSGYNSPGTVTTPVKRNVPELGDFKVIAGWENNYLIRVGGRIFVDWDRPGNNKTAYYKGKFIIE